MSPSMNLMCYPPLVDSEIHCLLVRITFHQLFKKLKHYLSKPLALLFNQLLSVGHVPHDWLKAIIVPVFKQGVAGQLSNYRPISLTCVPIAKFLRKFLCKLYMLICVIITYSTPVNMASVKVVLLQRTYSQVSTTGL